MNFDFIFLGQSILKYQVPLDIFHSINYIYEQNYKHLHKANKQLVGKIEDEHSLFYNGNDESKVKRHNILPTNITNYFIEVFKHYLNFNKIRHYKLHLNSIWVNEMKEHEYNPVHIHRGTLFTGLSSVMILKLPNTYGVEYSNDAVPQNGKLQILGASNGQFAKIDYQPPMNIRDFYVFPYDMRHGVYPFNGTKDTRRTLAGNCDVEFDPIKNRGAI
nr:Fe(II)-dependent oxygenase superfamily protein [uncultured Mediterranean phage uvMED]